MKNNTPAIPDSGSSARATSSIVVPRPRFLPIAPGAGGGTGFSGGGPTAQGKTQGQAHGGSTSAGGAPGGAAGDVPSVGVVVASLAGFFGAGFAGNARSWMFSGGVSSSVI